MQALLRRQRIAVTVWIVLALALWNGIFEMMVVRGVKEYLFRAALKLETLGKNNEALDLYKELKAKYPNTERGFSADKYIYRLSIVPNDFSAK